MRPGDLARGRSAPLYPTLGSAYRDGVRRVAGWLAGPCLVLAHVDVRGRVGERFLEVPVRWCLVAPARGPLGWVLTAHLGRAA